MAEITKLTTLLKELDDQLVTCMRCGMCQAVCPLFSRTGLEGDVARGKLVLLEHLAGEILADPKGVSEKLDRCLLCGTCQANCPSGVNVLDIFIRARTLMTGYFGLSRTKRVIFRGLLTHPALFNVLTGLAARFQGAFIKNEHTSLGSCSSIMNMPVVDNRHFKALATPPFHRLVPALDEKPGRSGLRVAFFVGCMIDKVYPSVGQATLKALSLNRIGVFMPQGQACCGIPALASGDSETFSKLASMNLDLFAKGEFDYLITSCATCTSTIKELWPTMLEGKDNLELAAKIAKKTMDISQFLTDVVGVEPVAAPGRTARTVTYHDPCHLKNSLGVTIQPRNLLKATPRYKFREMTDAGVCCGCGGSFNLAHYDLSKKIGRDKAENIARSGADVVATSCPACMLQITDMLSQAGTGMEVRHAIEIYAETIGERTESGKR